MQKLTGESKNIVAENIEKLKTLFPEAFTEEKVNLEALETLLGEYKETEPERYSFSWNGKAMARREAQKVSTGTLRPCLEESVDWDTTQNLYIEGDNLEVLKLLQKSYHNKIKMIYIDPPYNTGKDFVYKDNYHDNLQNYKELTGQTDEEGRRLSTNSETAGRYHSNWLNMMYPRLKLARNLLKEDGVIFISIDDNEVHNLRKICDEIFGEDNTLDRGSMIWVNKGSTKGFNKIVKNHEYIIAYAKNDNLVKSLFGLNFPNELINITERLQIKRSKKNPVDTITFPKGINIKDVSDIKFENMINPGTNQIDIVSGEMIFENGKLKHDVKLKASFPYKNQMLDYFSKMGSDEKTYDYKGQEWINVFFTKTGVPYYTKKREFSIISSLIDDIPNSGFNDMSSLEMMNFFDNPKPVSLLKKIASFFTTSNDIILDFFSGSATTAHAVMQLNKEDGGNRKFIMTQLPEPTDEKSEAYKAGYKTISDIGKERIRRAAKKIKHELVAKKKMQKQTEESNPLFEKMEEQSSVPSVNSVVDNLDLGFKVFKLDSSNIKAWDPATRDLELSLQDAITNIKDDRTQDDVLYEILLKMGLDLTVPIEKITSETDGGFAAPIYNIGLGALLVCLSDEITLKTVEQIGKLKEKLQPETCRVVFKDTGFKDDVVKTNAMQILKRYGIEEVRSI